MADLKTDDTHSSQSPSAGDALFLKEELAGSPRALDLPTAAFETAWRGDCASASDDCALLEPAFLTNYSCEEVAALATSLRALFRAGEDAPASCEA